MYLKSIEIHGFKSFANKLVFDFHNGITGIVGPNGSGKSNVADAVRWVLGEQSAKQLRGSSMQDVIFAGTEARKPLSYAYVAITMDNSDHSLPVDYVEVTVARRVYRSGESEYLLNGSPCRLKDVNELFYDTGIGKEGYSIIGQGQIDRILSGKPEERRELFDEAAGIVKFKRRKATTIKKLESERDNLVRINDILSELEGRVGPLERQASKAKDYLKKKDVLKEYEINAFLLEMEKDEALLAETESKAKIATDNMEAARAEKEKNEASYGNLQETLASMDASIESIRNEIQEAALNKEKLESQISILNEQINGAKNADEQYNERINAEHERGEKLSNELKAYEEAKVALDEELKEASTRVEAVAARLNEVRSVITGHNDTLNKNALEINEILNTRITNRTRGQKVETTVEQINIQKATLTQRQLLRKSEESKLTEDLNAKKGELDAAEAAISAKIAEIEKNEAAAKEWSKKIADIRAEIEADTTAFHRDKSRLDSLINLAERYEGYGGSVRRILELKENNRKIKGTVADIIRVEKKYETAIETALGGNIQNIVVEDETAAKELISFLKENKAGRVTFLPLTTVKGRDTSKFERALGKTGVIGMADSLVETDSVYTGVMSYLLGRVVVCDAVDNALKLAREFDFSLHIVTLEGEYLTPGGAMAGGAFKNNSNLLGRNREIADLEKSVKTLTADLESKKARVEEMRTARDLITSEIDEQKEELQKSYLAANSAKLSYQHALDVHEESVKVYEGLKTEADELDKKLSDLAIEKEQILGESSDLDKRQAEIEKQNEEIAVILEEQGKIESDLTSEYSELQISESAVKQRIEFTVANMERLQEEIKSTSEEELRLQNQLGESHQDTLKKQSDIEEIKATIEAGEAKIIELKKSLEDTLASKETLNSENRDFYKKNDELNQTIAELDKELFRLNSQREKIEEIKTASTNHIWAEYELTYHNALDLRDESMTNLTEIKRLATNVRDQIRALGDVNVNAIEEYKEVSERYNFLKGQHDDLVEAEKTLVAIIEELDTGMRKQFTEKFAQMQVEFDKAFKELFGGGKGTLELAIDEEEESKDILECGIRIIAQPPGKKLQNMMQLSGGEKALTAIALLFGIQNMKPSPFCLLDEIEAALDDSNVDRFAKYLSKLTKNTQFIIITHRRGTMNAADRLYGITMQEKGVSTLVSVNLIEADLEQ